MKIKIFFSLFFLQLSILGFSQLNHEFGIVLENDSYTSTVNDKYYTNGFEFFYRKLAKLNEQVPYKIIYEFKISQKIYNPFSPRVNVIEGTDRPFAGHLFASFGKNMFYENEKIFKKAIQLGFVGPNSFSEEVQELFHKTFGYKEVIGWENQIKNMLAIQGNFFYVAKIKFIKNSNKIDYQSVSEVNLGTISNGFTTGFQMRIALKHPLQSLVNSTMFAGTLSYEPYQKKSKECFVFFQPQFNYQLYDATIQGSLFQDNSPVTRKITHFRYGGIAGIKYRNNHWNLSYSIIYRTKEVDFPKNEGQYYGSISIGYLR